ncbi:MAG: hypothetical protein CALGDGBN_02802 [Pseudomonadales bacterium]|nr:hypothetical protein [Pseudomonadales bacterium]
MPHHHRHAFLRLHALAVVAACALDMSVATAQSVTDATAATSAIDARADATIDRAAVMQALQQHVTPNSIEAQLNAFQACIAQQHASGADARDASSDPRVLCRDRMSAFERSLPPSARAQMERDAQIGRDAAVHAGEPADALSAQAAAARDEESSR